VISEVSIVLVGAHSIHSNGAVFSRAGTALVAMMAKQHSVPVVVCCETYKFSEGVRLDSFTKNELGDFLLFISIMNRVTDGAFSTPWRPIFIFSSESIARFSSHPESTQSPNS
jgi:translation initiation factor eIF-2B subunit delta